MQPGMVPPMPPGMQPGMVPPTTPLGLQAGMVPPTTPLGLQAGMVPPSSGMVPPAWPPGMVPPTMLPEGTTQPGPHGAVLPWPAGPHGAVFTPAMGPERTLGELFVTSASGEIVICKAMPRMPPARSSDYIEPPQKQRRL
jgi:hypothetical protein